MLVDVLVPSKIDLKLGDRVEFDHKRAKDDFCSYGERKEGADNG